ncbi:MAG: tyrosine-type recombinase/integrase [Burkholderiales bacterium]|nr:tyrosine-type recombinase/integrase [Burkholderiales bacterium]
MISNYDIERYKKKRLHEVAIRVAHDKAKLKNVKQKNTSLGTVNRELAALSHLFSKAKGGSRLQPITQHLAEFLEGYMAALPKSSEWLFPSVAAREGHTMDIRKPFRRVVIAAGLTPDKVVWHTLRHTAITHLVQAGVDLPTVKRISGHKTLLMVERYAHQNGEHIKAAMDKLEDRYQKIS